MKTKAAGRVLGPLGTWNRRPGQVPTHSQPAYNNSNPSHNQPFLRSPILGQKGTLPLITPQLFGEGHGLIPRADQTD